MQWWQKPDCRGATNFILFSLTSRHYYGGNKIFNILVRGSLALAVAAFLVISYDYIDHEIKHEIHRGLGPLLALGIIGFFIILKILSRKNYAKLANYLFVAFYFIVTTIFVFTWGPSLPMATILYVLTAIFAGVLISSNAAFVTAIGTAIILTTAVTLENYGIINYASYWKNQQEAIGDKIPEIILIFIIVYICKLYNQETKKSLEVSQTAEASLRLERGLLKTKIKAQEIEIKKAQLEKMTGLYRFAELGKLSAGIFHDLMNPLTALTINLNSIKTIDPENKNLMERAQSAAAKMEDYVIALKRQLKSSHANDIFSPQQEISQIIKILDHHFKQRNLEIIFQYPKQAIEIIGDRLHFGQLIMNLLTNAAESYDQLAKIENKNIIVMLAVANHNLILTIADHGQGISPENLTKIFEPFFSTKTDKGLGIGLATVKHIVETDFCGQIECQSIIGVGTKFIFTMPLNKNYGTKNISRSIN